MMRVRFKPAVIHKPTVPPISAEAGLVLMDSSLQIMAFDSGAANILNSRNQPRVKPRSLPSLPEEIMKLIRGHDSTDRSSATTHLRVNNNGYICRIYVLESYEEITTQPIIALHLERDVSANDTICEIFKKYNLTVREQEVLRGISLGLATKELANRMNISPNTVKAFLRQVMIKMGVQTRAEIVAQILHGASLDEPTDLPNTVPPFKRRAMSSASSPHASLRTETKYDRR
jgi:DNA-binding CsgD family transcriptional regulator